jgi:hypothetical protein
MESMHRVTKCFVTLVSMYVPLAACGVSHFVNGPSDGDAGVEVHEAAAVAPTGLCLRWAELQCRGEETCCSSPGRTPESCRGALTQQCAENLMLDQIASHASAGFDLTSAEAAFSELSQMIDRCDPESVRWSLSAAGLRGMFKGSFTQGQSCKPAQAVTADRGTQGAALVSCSAAGEVACLPKSLLGDWTCEGQQPSGASCVTDENCEDGSYCSIPSQALLGHCAEQLPLMAACSEDDECSSLICRDASCIAADAESVYCPKS